MSPNSHQNSPFFKNHGTGHFGSSGCCCHLLETIFFLPLIPALWQLNCNDMFVVVAAAFGGGGDATEINDAAAADDSDCQVGIGNKLGPMYKLLLLYVCLFHCYINIVQFMTVVPIVVFLPSCTCMRTPLVDIYICRPIV